MWSGVRMWWGSLAGEKYSRYNLYCISRETLFVFALKFAFVSALSWSFGWCFRAAGFKSLGQEKEGGLRIKGWNGLMLKMVKNLTFSWAGLRTFSENTNNNEWFSRRKSSDLKSGRKLKSIIAHLSVWPLFSWVRHIWPVAMWKSQSHGSVSYHVFPPKKGRRAMAGRMFLSWPANSWPGGRPLLSHKYYRFLKIYFFAFKCIALCLIK